MKLEVFVHFFKGQLHIKNHEQSDHAFQELKLSSTWWQPSLTLLSLKCERHFSFILSIQFDSFIAFEPGDWIVRLIGEFSLNISTFLVSIVLTDSVEWLWFVKVNLCVMLDISPQWKTSCDNLQCKKINLVSCAWICKIVKLFVFCH